MLNPETSPVASTSIKQGTEHKLIRHPVKFSLKLSLKKKKKKVPEVIGELRAFEHKLSLGTNNKCYTFPHHNSVLVGRFCFVSGQWTRFGLITYTDII